MKKINTNFLSLLKKIKKNKFLNLNTLKLEKKNSIRKKSDDIKD